MAIINREVVEQQLETIEPPIRWRNMWFTLRDGLRQNDLAFLTAFTLYGGGIFPTKEAAEHSAAEWFRRNPGGREVVEYFGAFEVKQ